MSSIHKSPAETARQAHLSAIVESCTDAVLSTDLNGIMLVAMTGWGREEDKRQALEAGFDAHLTKPVEIDVLESALESRYKPPSAQGPHSA